MSDMRPYTATMPNAGAEGCLKLAGHRWWWRYTIIIRIRYLPPDHAYSCGVSDIRYGFNFFSPTSRVATLCSELCHLTSVLVCMSALGSLYSSVLGPCLRPSLELCLWPVFVSVPKTALRTATMVCLFVF